MSKLVTVNYIVRNGGKYVRLFLNSLKNQTYRDFEVNIFDNNSTDDTREIIKKEYPEFILYENKENIGVWAGFEKLINLEIEPPGRGLTSAISKYVICMTDVILKEDFLEKAIAIMEANPDCGALQAKVYQMELYKIQETSDPEPSFTKVIDTCGFKIFKSRKVINLGHGEEDNGSSFARASKDKQFDFSKQQEIFGVEGVIPIFKLEALETCRINGWLIDPDYRVLGGVPNRPDQRSAADKVSVGPLGYGDDLDLAWRMRLFGWKQIFAPSVIAYHDRSTTKGYSKSLKNYLQRVKERQKIDIIKRRLDWRNVRFTIIKNDYIINILKDLPYILTREIGVFGYTVLFEPQILMEFANFMKNLSGIIKKRREIMKKAKISPADMKRWFLIQ